MELSYDKGYRRLRAEWSKQALTRAYTLASTLRSQFAFTQHYALISAVQDGCSY